VTNGPTIAEANVVHLAWDVMVGLGTLLALLSIWFGLTWLFRRDLPKTKWFLRIAACAGVASVLTMEAGWVVTEVGRQPWIVHNYMKVEQAATANGGIWLTFLAVLAIYAVLGVTTVLVLRGMSRRYRDTEDVDDSDVPYGPSGPGILGGDTPREVPVG
jgi:cytochrome d ubiquinol oxidase subunit I